MTNNKVIYQGAEAQLIKDKYMDIDVVLKKRINKSYRIKQIDQNLIQQRTREEAKLISEARNFGVPVPIIYDVDLQKGIITMEYIKGKRIKDIFNDLSDNEKKKICKKIGRNISYLHKNNIIHGDITTSNMILKDEKVHMIDFGLGCKNTEIETKGVDLHVLMEAIESTHSKYSKYFKYILEEYQKENPKEAHKVINKINEIVKRGRYR